MLDHVQLGSSLALRSFGRLGSALSVFDFLHLGSSISIRSLKENVQSKTFKQMECCP